MFTTSERRDQILRMIAAIRQMVDAAIGKVRDGEDAAEPLAQARASLAALLGPMAGVAPMMDSATAAQMVGDPDVIAAWAQVTAAESEAHRAAGDSASADALARRALELALEAQRRALAPHPDLPPLIERLRAQANG